MADFGREAVVYLHSFVRRVVVPELTPDQIKTTLTYLTLLAERHSLHRAMIGQIRGSLEKHYFKANSKWILPFIPFAKAADWFPSSRKLDTQGEPFADDTIRELIELLDALLEMPETVANFNFESGIHLLGFIHCLQAGFLTEAQRLRVVAHLNDLRRRYPDIEETIEQHIFRVENLTAGRLALNIVGNDVDGVKFELNEYRGKIVVLYFSGNWCRPCRGEYPYQRFMLDQFKNDSVVILGVNSDEDLAIVRETKNRERLNYRIWWDGHEAERTQGPIATAWDVSAWPSVYILDDEGVIRYVHKRRAKVIAAVQDLLDEKRTRETLEQDL